MRARSTDSSAETQGTRMQPAPRLTPWPTRTSARGLRVRALYNTGSAVPHGRVFSQKEELPRKLCVPSSLVNKH